MFVNVCHFCSWSLPSFLQRKERHLDRCWSGGALQRVQPGLVAAFAASYSPILNTPKTIQDWSKGIQTREKTLHVLTYNLLSLAHSFHVFPRAFSSASARSRTEAAEAWLTRRIDEVYRELTREPLDDTMEVGMNQDESSWGILKDKTPWFHSRKRQKVGCQFHWITWTRALEEWGEGGEAKLRRLPDGSFDLLTSAKRGGASSGYGTSLNSLSDGARLGLLDAWLVFVPYFLNTWWFHYYRSICILIVPFDCFWKIARHGYCFHHSSKANVCATILDFLLPLQGRLCTEHVVCSSRVHQWHARRFFAIHRAGWTRSLPGYTWHWMPLMHFRDCFCVLSDKHLKCCDWFSFQLLGFATR